MKHQHATAAVTSRLHDGAAVSASKSAALPDNWSVGYDNRQACRSWPVIGPRWPRRAAPGAREEGEWLNTAIVHVERHHDVRRWAYCTRCHTLSYL